jgi:integrase
MSLKKTRYPGVYRYESRKGRKSDVFRARIYDPSEKSGQKWIGTFPTAREAHDAKLAAEQQRQKAVSVESTMTHAEYSVTWLDDHPRSQSSMDTYRAAIQRFIEAFGERELGAVTRLEARRWAIGTPYVNVRTARTMLNDAFEDGLLESNPLSKLRIPQSQGRRKETPPTAAEVLALAQTAATSDLSYGLIVKNALLLGFGSLLRPNEMGVLRWEDIDLENKVIRVFRGMDRRGNIGPTKSKSEGLIALTPLAEAAIQDMREEHPVDRETVFLARRGELLKTQTLDGYWRVVRGMHAGKTGNNRFQNMSFYLATRHAGATFMRNVLGIRIEDIEMQLRHKGRNLLDLYTHPTERLGVERILEAWPEDLDACSQERP